MGIRQDYRDALLTRFAGREALSTDRWHERFAPDVDRKALGELFDEVESSYGFAAGLLRPDDPLRILNATALARGAWQRFRFWGIARDAANNLDDELMWRIDRRRQPCEGATIKTVAELARLWCGAETPTTGGRSGARNTA